MKNVVRCPNCGSENPFYKLTCINCKTYLRERIFNLDLWNIIGLLIENPVKAFRQIIHAEHKNFIILIIILFSIKAFINARFLSIFFSGSSSLRINLEIGLLVSLVTFFIAIYLYSLLMTFINRTVGLKTRIRDNNALLSYSLIPYPFALIILFPIELIVFGGYLFSSNPSPFIIKPAIAYALLSFEGLLFLWGIYLSAIGVFTISKNIIYSLSSGLLFHFYLIVFLFVLSKILFTS